MEPPVLIEDLGPIYATKDSPRKRGHGIYRCYCGKEFRTLKYAVKIGRTKSCGCYQSNTVSKSRKIHGSSEHPLYHIWKNIAYRLTNPNAKYYKNYGGSGIKFSKEWEDVNNFIRDMEPIHENGLKLLRVDRTKDYSKENCYFGIKVKQKYVKKKKVEKVKSKFKMSYIYGDEKMNEILI
jgi:hypothetical protein